MDLRIFPPEEMIETEITLPHSKSMYNRAVLMQALASGPALECEPPCDDARAMIDALGSDSCEVNVGPAGTAMRFLTAYYAATDGADVVIDGNERMRQRPIGPLVDVLRQCGADIEYTGEVGFPPVHVRGRHLIGGTVDVDASISSQYISALMMVAPTFSSRLTINLSGEPASLPYIKMTLGMMQHRGIDCELYNDQITVNPGTYAPMEEPYAPLVGDIERDWSAAAFWYTIAAVSAGWVTLKGLRLPSLQGDSRAAEIYERLGVLTNAEEPEDPDSCELSASPEVYSRLDLDLLETPDLVQPLVACCCLIGVPFHFTGVKSLRIKETDRLEALKDEAAKIGCELEIPNDNEIKWDGRRRAILQLPVFDTYGDHRMAMAFAAAALYIDGIVIRDAEVVSKSYPGFWEDMAHAGFRVEEVVPAE